MSWVLFEPAAKVGGKKPTTPVAISVSKAGRTVQRIYLTVRDGTPGLDWWRFRAPVTVFLGVGENAGRISVRADGRGRCSIMGKVGRGKVDAPILQIAAPDLPQGGLPQQPASWEVLGEALIVTLPWSGAKGLAKEMAAPPPVEPVPVPVANSQPDVPIAPAPLTDGGIRLGIALPAPKKPAAVVVPAGPKPSAAEEPLTSTKPPIPLSHPEIERWAIEHGVGSATHGFDLAKFNQKRIKMGERPFVIRKTGR